MLKRIYSLLLILAMVLSIQPVSAEDTAVLTVSVDESTVIKQVDKKMYGINCEWSPDNHTLYLEEGDSLLPKEEYVECFEDYLPLTRMAGMSANAMYWKQAIGPLEDRGDLQFWHYSPQKLRYGIVEWIKGNQLADSDTEFVYTVNLKDIDNLADLVRFLRLTPDDPNAIGTDGVNWAQRRVDLGIANPVPIAVWELGNETDAAEADGGFGYSYWQYVSACEDAIEAIKSIEPQAKFSAHIKTDYTNNDNWKNWHRWVLRQIGDDLDYLSVHRYYSWDKVHNWTNKIDELEDDIVTYTGSDRIKLYFSEQATRPVSDVWSSGFDYMTPHTLAGTLSTAQFYVGIANRPSVAMSTYHSMNSSSWATAYEFKGDVKLTAVGDLMRIMQDNFCGQLVETTLTGQDDTTQNLTVAGAVKTDNGINLLLINRTEEPVRFDFDFDKTYTVKSKSYITGESKEADNFQLVNPTTGYTDINKREITCVHNEVCNLTDIQSYTVDPVTLVMLNMQENDQDDPEDDPEDEPQGDTKLYALKNDDTACSEQDDFYAYNVVGTDDIYVGADRTFASEKSLIYAEYAADESIVKLDMLTLPATAYEKGFGAAGRITKIAEAHRSTMGEKFNSLVGTIIEGSVVGSDDCVILKSVTTQELTNYKLYGNGLENVYVWVENADGTISKLYGGTGSYNKFKGNASTPSGATSYALPNTDGSVPLMYAAGSDYTNSGTGSVFYVRPFKNNTITYGREDLDMSGVSTFTYKIAYHKKAGDMSGGVPKISAHIAQPSETTETFRVFDIAGDGKIRDFSSSVASGATVDVGHTCESASGYYTVIVTVDNSGDAPRAMYAVKKNNGDVIRTSDWRNIPAGTFDFSKDMSLKLSIYDEAGKNNTVILGYYDFETQFADDNTHIIKHFEKENGTHAKLFIWNSLNEIRPLRENLRFNF